MEVVMQGWSEGEAIVIDREESFRGRQSRYPWGWLYSINGHSYDTHLGATRAYAKKMARKYNTTVVERF